MANFVYTLATRASGIKIFVLGVSLGLCCVAYVDPACPIILNSSLVYPAGQVTDSGLLAMSALTQLRTLDLSGCVSVTERGLAVLAAALRRLQTLKLGGTSRVATIGNGSIAAISALTSLTHLDLSGSHDITDTGKIPLSIGHRCGLRVWRVLKCIGCC